MSNDMSATRYAIVTCIEYLRGRAAQARSIGEVSKAEILEQAADGMWHARARLAKETKAAFGAEVDRLSRDPGGVS